MVEVDHLGFVFDKQQMDFETLGSKIAKRNYEDYTGRIQGPGQEQMHSANRQANPASDILVLELQSNSVAYHELD